MIDIIAQLATDLDAFEYDYDYYSYTALKNRLVRLLLRNDITITGRMYNGYETDTGYHHYTVDAAQYYETEE